MTEQENYLPRTVCELNEHKCKNSYGKTICVREKLKTVACFNYPKVLCDDFSVKIQSKAVISLMPNR